MKLWTAYEQANNAELIFHADANQISDIVKRNAEFMDTITSVYMQLRSNI